MGCQQIMLLLLLLPVCLFGRLLWKMCADHEAEHFVVNACNHAVLCTGQLALRSIVPALFIVMCCPVVCLWSFCLFVSMLKESLCCLVHVLSSSSRWLSCLLFFLFAFVTLCFLLLLLIFCGTWWKTIQWKYIAVPFTKRKSLWELCSLKWCLKHQTVDFLLSGSLTFAFQCSFVTLKGRKQLSALAVLAERVLASAIACTVLRSLTIACLWEACPRSREAVWPPSSCSSRPWV